MVWHLQGSEAGAAAVQAGREGQEAEGDQGAEPADGGRGRTRRARAPARTIERAPVGRVGSGILMVRQLRGSEAGAAAVQAGREGREKEGGGP